MTKQNFFNKNNNYQWPKEQKTSSIIATRFIEQSVHGFGFGQFLFHMQHEQFLQHRGDSGCLVTSLVISPFHFAKFLKNSSSGSRVMRMCNFWAQQGPFPHMKKFFFPENLSMSLVSFIHAYSSQKSKSDINLLVKY